LAVSCTTKFIGLSYWSKLKLIYITTVFIKVINKTMINKEKQQWIQENYPFLSYVKYGKKDINYHLGIIINTDAVISSMYNIEAVSSPSLRQQLIAVGEKWWWESNRLIPINILLGKEMQIFSHCIINMNSKDVEIAWGPRTSLDNIIQKRIKRRSIQLVRKID
jgi:hypothetical protein